MVEPAAVLPHFKSSPIRALQAIIQSPAGVMNIVWLSLAILLQSVFIGQIAVFGYGAELIRARAGRPERTTPDIDSNRLGDYIAKGLWPFLVVMLVQVLLSFMLALPIIVVAAAMILATSGGQASEAAAAGIMLLGIPLILVAAMFVIVLMVPFMIRAMICQDFAKSLDLGWARAFVKLMFWEMLRSAFLFMVISMGIIAVGALFLCVGYIPALGWLTGAWMHLLAQWYEIYLSLGGEPAPPATDGEIINATLV